MRARVYAAGKLKDAGLERMCATYCKRARPFMPVELVEVRAAAGLRKRLQSRDPAVRILLDERGEQLTTRELAGWIQGYRERGARSLELFIGDAHGFNDEDRAGADRLLALSRLTLPHRLVRVVLLEQLYRAASLLAGHPYHHD